MAGAWLDLMPALLHPPAVRYPTAPSRALAWVGAALWLLTSLSLALWCYARMAMDSDWAAWLPGVLALCLSLAAAALLRQQWQRMLVGQLQYRAGLWQFEPQAGLASWDVSQLDIHWDAQSCLLLSGRDAAGRRQWFWLQRTDAPAYWHALRCALYAPQAPIDKADVAIDNEAIEQIQREGDR